jgi:hypothetical protein
MTLLNLIKAPLNSHKDYLSDKKKLKKFGLALSALLISAWGVLFPWFLGNHYPYWPWIIAGLVSSASLINAFWIKPIYFVFIYISHIVGTINISILLSIVFYFFMLHIGFILKRLGRDPMARKLGPNIHSYRIIRIDNPKDRLERPF